MLHRFDEFELDERLGELRFAGKTVPMEPKAFGVLLFLVQNSDHLVTKDEIFSAVWEGRAVSDATLASRVKQARAALGDSGEKQEYIKTLHGRGLRFVKEVHTDPTVVQESIHSLTTLEKKRLAYVGSAGLPWAIAIGAAIVAIALISVNSKDVPESQSIVRPNSVAVLTFDDISPNGNQGFFADGIAAEILTSLAKVDQLLVVGGVSSSAFKNRDATPQEMGNTLGVGTLLRGNVLRQDERVRVNARLIDVKSGYVLWSETYSRQVDDIFEVQYAIADAVTRELRVVFAGDATRTIVPLTPSTESLEAYEYYVQARNLLMLRSRQNAIVAGELFEKAIAEDENFADAYAGLATAQFLTKIYSPPVLNEEYEEPIRNARHALALDQTLSQPYAVLAGVCTERAAWIEAEQNYREALIRAPNNADANVWYGRFLFAMGRLKEAEAKLANAYRRDPASPAALFAYGEILSATGDLARAGDLATRSRALGLHYADILLFLIDWMKGNHETAIEHYLHFRMQADPQNLSTKEQEEIRQLWNTAIYGTESQRDALAESLQAHVELNGPFALWNATYFLLAANRPGILMDLRRDVADHFLDGMFRDAWRPIGQGIRQHPDFYALADRYELTSYWQEFGYPDLCQPRSNAGLECD